MEGGYYYHYLCYIDVLKMPGQDKAVDRAIETLKEFNTFVRVLSVYPSSSSYHHTISPSTRSPTNLPETSHTTPPPHQGKRRSVSFIGYGKFAQFLCERLTRVCGTGGGGSVNFSATNRKEDDTGCAHHAATLGIRYYPDMKDMLDNEKPDIIVIATSILSLRDVINKLLSAIMKSERGRAKDLLLVDVCSVKEYPQQIMREAFQDHPNVSILCTHPMFGPDSGKYGWYNLPLVYDDGDGNGSTSPTSHGNDDDSRSWWLSLFERCGCRLVSMSTAEHDKISAATQFITHLTGRVLGGITPRLHTTNIDTLGFRSLIKLMHNTINDR
ncbi:prephenate dehydrogenase (NADP(+)) [Perkinsus olseni]|uniref:Prephenate dehydrogenase (NADP(+)) n=1 Tax=Perkinsus olseni TaxID=32597 RepID=A0A7J6S854_PEROL|nr:prephenate dehydrogenase (NADP(+)) [Perkinsus olseni]